MLSFAWNKNENDSINKFSIEFENNRTLPFLDVNISCKSDSLVTSVYHKATYTGLLMNFFSFVPHCYKNGLVKTLVDRTFKINNNWFSFDTDLKNLHSTLCKNLFPPKLIDKVVLTYLDKVRTEKTSIDPDSNINCRYFKLPYIGKYSSVTKCKVKELTNKFCKNIDLKIIFTTSKIGVFFN